MLRDIVRRAQGRGDERQTAPARPTGITRVERERWRSRWRGWARRLLAVGCGFGFVGKGADDHASMRLTRFAHVDGEWLIVGDRAGIDDRGMTGGEHRPQFGPLAVRLGVRPEQVDVDPIEVRGGQIVAAIMLGVPERDPDGAATPTAEP